ncbi:MAG: hypothetical protein C5B59_19440 [Bacteroidetes bacterium]|nr:MAG: hypothetical protein C5B59_19440 [Bacteroidota bacterium]
MAEPLIEEAGHGAPPKRVHQEVTIVRGWKEYLGESLLIIFSVLLALILTELINQWHESKETSQIIRDIRNELSENRAKETDQLAYQQKVLSNIDSALNNLAFQQLIVTHGEFNLKLIAPDGLLHRYLTDIAWQIAKQKNIESRIGLPDLSLLTHIYQEQERVMRSEDELAKVLFDRASRNSENIRITLILMRDTYKGWAVDRAPGLLKEYDLAIAQLK